MKDPCKCRMKCYNEVSEIERKTVHRNYWIMTYKQRRTWLLKNIMEVDTKRRRKNNEEGNYRKTCTRNYYFDKKRICKVMFSNTLGYSNDKFISCALRANIAESIRGKHDHSYHSIQEEDDLFMQQHIESFEPGIAHYRRAHAPHCLYLDPSLTITDLYDDYKKTCEKDSRKTLSLSSYQRKLKKLNISFAKLGHEQCEPCLKHEEHDCVWYSEKNSCQCCKKNSCDCCRKFNSLFMVNPFKK